MLNLRILNIFILNLVCSVISLYVGIKCTELVPELAI
jgi:hypothetical protein